MELRHLPWLLVLCSCASTTPKRLVIPDEMRRPIASGQTVAEANAPEAARTRRSSTDTYPVFGTDDLSKPRSTTPAPAAPTASPAAPIGAAPAQKPAAPAPKLTPPSPPTDASQRYTLRLVEKGRVWEVELPESTGGYEVRIPLGPGIESPTLADQELLGKTPPEGRSKSYLATLAKLSEMYSAHRYELALIEVVNLEQEYPKDPRLLAMKGSLFQKLGKTALARESWKKALEIEPSNTTVAEALRALKEE